MHEMSEDEQLQAAMKASLENDAASQDEEMSDGDNDEVEVVDPSDLKPAASEEEAKKEEAASFIPDLLAVQVEGEPEKGARMQFRMPDGKRKIRKFLPTDTVKIIYAYLAVSCGFLLHDIFVCQYTTHSLTF